MATGIIYKLTIGDYFYVGRTKGRFSTRYNSHKKSCFNRRKKTYNSKKYKIIRQLGVKRDNWNQLVKWKIIYNCPMEYLECYERHCIYISVNNPFCLNTQFIHVDKIYTKTIVNWGTLTTEDKKRRDRECKRKWSENNKEYFKEYNLKHKEHLNEYYKEWKQHNTDHLNEYHKEYRYKNKTHKCDICKTKLMAKGDYKKHCKTKNHLKNIR